LAIRRLSSWELIGSVHLSFFAGGAGGLAGFDFAFFRFT
jgi:hypothetical protein